MVALRNGRHSVLPHRKRSSCPRATDLSDGSLRRGAVARQGRGALLHPKAGRGSPRSPYQPTSTCFPTRRASPKGNRARRRRPLGAGACSGGRVRLGNSQAAVTNAPSGEPYGPMPVATSGLSSFLKADPLTDKFNLGWLLLGLRRTARSRRAPGIGAFGRPFGLHRRFRRNSPPALSPSTHLPVALR